MIDLRPTEGWVWGSTVIRRRVAAAITAAIAIAFAAWFSHAALQRHAALQTNATDLGYYHQAVWNTLHGAPLRTTLQVDLEAGLPSEIDIAQLKRPDSLLSAHVEPILLPVSFLYVWWPGPETLLVLQVLAVAIGAWPVHRVAARSFRTVWAGPVGAAAFLLAPPLHWSLLSDVHPNVFAVGAVAWTIDFALAPRSSPASPAAASARWRVWLARLARLARQTDAGFWIAAGIALACREDVAVVIAPIALYRLIRGPRRWAGALLLAGSIAWLGVCLFAILPAFGTDASPFLYRYAHLGTSLPDAFHRLIADPGHLVRLIARPEAHDFWRVTFLATGGFWLLAPIVSLPAVPVLAINLLSSWEWAASGRAHYSALIVPVLSLAAVVGGARLTTWIRRFGPDLRPLVLIWLLAGGIAAGWQEGLTPFTPHYEPAVVTDHHRLLERFTRQIPPDALVSASANVYTHLSSRPDIALFPTVRNADFLLIDVTGSSYPVTSVVRYFRIWELLDSGRYGVVDAADGYLLLRRGAGAPEPPREFWTFLGRNPARDRVATARRGPTPRRMAWRSAYRGSDRVVRVTTEWVTGQAPGKWQTPIARAHLDGGVRDLTPDISQFWWLQAAPLAPGQTVEIAFPPLPADDLQSVEVGPIGGPTVAVQIEEATGDQPLAISLTSVGGSPGPAATGPP